MLSLVEWVSSFLLTLATEYLRNFFFSSSIFKAFCWYSDLAFHFSTLLLPVASWTSLTSDIISPSWAKMGIITNWINPDYPLAIWVVSRSHIMDTSRPCAFSVSPWLKNSWKSKSVQVNPTWKSLKLVLMSHAWSRVLDTSYLLYSMVLGEVVSISLSLFWPPWIPNLFRWTWNSSLNYFIVAMSVNRIASAILFFINLISDLENLPLKKSYSAISSNFRVWAAW